MDAITVTLAAAGIFGAALLTTVLGFRWYAAGGADHGPQRAACDDGLAVAGQVGLALSALGMAAGMSAAWSRAFWGILAASFAARAWLAERRRRDHERSERKIKP